MSQSNVLMFPTERIAYSLSQVEGAQLRTNTFYREGEVDEIVEGGKTYGEFKSKVGLIYLKATGEVPEDILFLLHQRECLQTGFLDEIRREYGRFSKKYRKTRAIFKDISDNCY